MKSNSLLLGLAFLLAGLAVGVSVLSYWYIQLTRQLNRAQATIARVELHQNRLKAMLTEAVEHSQRDPSIHPLLQSLGIKPAAPPAAQKPAGR